MTSRTVLVNRAPVLTLWGAVVAERLGYDRDEALTLGKALAGLNAASKGRRLGLYKPAAESETKPRAPGREVRVALCGREIPARRTKEGVRAVSGPSAIEPAQVQGYLERSFGESLRAVRDAMARLARAYEPDDLAPAAFSLYERFRPQVAAGTRGWGQKGNLDLELVRSLAPGR